MMFVQQYAPNTICKHYTAAGTAWGLLASDGTLYTGATAYASLIAAGKQPFPGLEPGPGLQYLSLRSENGSGADGSPFYYRLGSTVLPASDDEGWLVSGSGGVRDIPGPVNLLWLRKTVSGDEIIVEGRY